MGTEFFRDKIILLDGAMGTVLQQRGLPPGGVPELLNLTDPALLASVYREYVDAGSQVVYANTFGANGLKLAFRRSSPPPSKRRGRPWRAVPWWLWTWGPWESSWSPWAL